MDTLRETLYNVISGYAVEGLNCYSYLTTNPAQDVFIVSSIGKFGDQRIADTDLIVRLVDELIIIERDVNDKPLVDALVQAGIPRHQIILAYDGEEVPKAADILVMA